MTQRLRSDVEDIRQGLQCANIEAVFATINIALTQGIFLTNYVLDMGSPNLVCGVVESLPFLVQFVYLISPMLVRRLKSRKPVAALFALAHRLSWLVLILLLYVDWSQNIKLTLMILTLLVANAFAVIGHNAWFSWMTDLVPAAIRGSYYGKRNTYLGLTSLSALFIGSHILTHYRDLGRHEIGYTICFSTAIVSALFAAYMIFRQYEPKPDPVPPLAISQLLRTARLRPMLMRYIAFYCVWQFSLGIGAAFFGVHMAKVLKMNPAMMGYQTLVSSVFALLSSRPWGRAIDRVGDRTVLVASGILIVLHVWIWMGAREGFLLPVWIVSVLGGFAWGGFNIAAFSWVQKLCGNAERQYNYGLLGFFSGPAFMMGSLLGGAITTFLPEVLFYLGNFEVLHFHLAFALSATGRGIAILMIYFWSMGYNSNHDNLSDCLRKSFSAMRR